MTSRKFIISTVRCPNPLQRESGKLNYIIILLRRIKAQIGREESVR
jgi:hypothetical protein